MVEGGGSDDFRHVKTMLYARPELLHRILAVNAAAVTAYLNAQIAGGRAGGDDLRYLGRRALLGGLRGVFARLHASAGAARAHAQGRRGARVPRIVFTKGGGQWLESMARLRGRRASASTGQIDLGEARRRVGDRVALQGNLDPMALLRQRVRDRERGGSACSTATARRPGHVFNLGHGISQHTPPESVQALIEAVHTHSLAAPRGLSACQEKYFRRCDCLFTPPWRCVAPAGTFWPTVDNSGFPFRSMRCTIVHRRIAGSARGSDAAIASSRATYSQTYPQAFPAPAEGVSAPLKIARVALDVPLEESFDFLVPESIEAPTGALVVVPFGRTRKVGVVVGRAQRSVVAESRLKPIESAVRDVPPLDEPLLELFRFCAGYYHRALGEVIAASLPPRLRQVARRTLAAAPGAGAGPTGFAPLHELTAQQRAAIEACRAGIERFHPTLLLGVTGSGKTEVYLAADRGRAGARAARRWCWCRRSASRPSSRRRCAAASRTRRSPPLHSGLAGGSAPRHWLAAQPAPRASCSARASRYSCRCRDLGLIVVDEEHDRLVQAAGRPALFGARRGRVPRAAPRHSRDPGLGHAVAGKLCATRSRAATPLAAGRARNARRDAGGAHGRHLRRHVPHEGLALALLEALRATPGTRRAEPGVREPPRLRAGAVVPRVRLDVHLQRAAARRCCTGARAAALPPLRATRGASREHCPDCGNADLAPLRPRHAARWRKRWPARFPQRASRASTATARAQRRLARACSSACTRARPTSWSARRCWPRGTTSRI